MGEVQLEIFGVSVYFILNPVAVCIGIYLAFKRSQLYNLDPKIVLDLSIISVSAAFVGARIFHVLFESPFYYQKFPLQILNIWQGGFVFYGGLIFGVTAGLIYLKIKQVNYFQAAALATMPLSIGYILGRFVCFLTGCCYGSYCIFPWAVRGRHPTQLYALVGEALLVAILYFAEKKNFSAGKIVSIWLMGHGLNRIIMELWRGDPRGIWLGLPMSLVISVFLLLAGLVLWFMPKNEHKRA